MADDGQGAAPGWYPTPDGQQRYWDGRQWTEHVAPGAVGQHARAQGAATVAQPDTRPWYAKKRFLIPLGAVGVLFFLALLGSFLPDPPPSEQAQPVRASTTTASPAPSATSPTEEPTPTETTPEATTAAPVEPEAAPVEESGEYGPQPPDQTAVLQAVTIAQSASRDVDNDLQRGAVLRDRTNAICSTLSSKSVAGWTGVVETLDANGEGKGVVAIDIAEDVQVKTWNNAFSDIMDETLIDPSSPLFDQALSLSEGQVVKFSGTFLPDDENCIREASITLGGTLQTPAFIFRFTSIEALS
jgi:hypothetical protein